MMPPSPLRALTTELSFREPPSSSRRRHDKSSKPANGAHGEHSSSSSSSSGSSSGSSSSGSGSSSGSASEAGGGGGDKDKAAAAKRVDGGGGAGKSGGSEGANSGDADDGWSDGEDSYINLMRRQWSLEEWGGGASAADEDVSERAALWHSLPLQWESEKQALIQEVRFDTVALMSKVIVVRYVFVPCFPLVRFFDNVVTRVIFTFCRIRSLTHVLC